MKVAIGTDHAGINLKPAIIKYLEDNGIQYKDFGTYTHDSVDYPDFAEKVADAVAAGEYTYGILVCGTGIGISIAANKVPGIRCALCHDCFSAKYTRKHNDANILAMGERVIGAGLAIEILDVFLNTCFEGGRHALRVDKITQIEKKHLK